MDALDLRTVHCAGNSMGGWVALELARRGRARSVSAISPTGFYRRSGAIFLNISLASARLGAKLITPVADAVLRTRVGRAIVISQMVDRPAAIPIPDAVAMVAALTSSTGFQPDLKVLTAARCRALNVAAAVPVVIAWGERDRLLFRRQRWRAMAAVPWADVVLIEDAGHVPTYDAPAAVAELLERNCARSYSSTLDG